MEQLKNQYEGFHAEFYDIMHTDNTDLFFYLESAKKHGDPVLEIGSGTGRLLIPLSKEGVRIVGLEPSPEMARICRDKALREGLSDSNILEATARDFQIDTRFKFAFIACNTFQHFLSTEDQRSALLNIKKHLAPRGKLIIDMVIPDINEMVSSNGKQEIFEIKNPINGNKIVDKFTPKYDFVNQIEDDEIILEEYRGDSIVRESTANVKMTYIFPRELLLLLTSCGYRINNVWKNYKGAPLDAQANMIVVEAENGM